MPSTRRGRRLPSARGRRTLRPRRRRHRRHLREAADAVPPRRARHRRTARDGGRFSHVDADHITGILDLFADVERARADGEADPVAIGGLWQQRLRRDARRRARIAVREPPGDDEPSGTGERGGGERLRRHARDRAGREASAHGDQAWRLAERLLRGPADRGGRPGAPTWALGGATLAISGPTRANLDQLRNEWIDWIVAPRRRLRHGRRLGHGECRHQRPQPQQHRPVRRDGGRRRPLHRRPPAATTSSKVSRRPAFSRRAASARCAS